MNVPIMDFAFPVFNRGLSSRIHEWSPGVLEYGHCDEARTILDSPIVLIFTGSAGEAHGEQS